MKRSFIQVNRPNTVIAGKPRDPLSPAQVSCLRLGPATSLKSAKDEFPKCGGLS